jgi:hypothetical protein
MTNQHSDATSTDLDEVIRSNVRDLERLANFYATRGLVEQADEIKQAVRKIRHEMAVRLLSDDCRRRESGQISH